MGSYRRLIPALFLGVSFSPQVRGKGTCPRPSISWPTCLCVHQHLGHAAEPWLRESQAFLPSFLKVLVTEGYDQYFVKEIQTEPTLSYRCSNIYLILAILVVTRTPVIPINVIMAANVPNSGTILICLISLLCPSQ